MSNLLSFATAPFLDRNSRCGFINRKGLISCRHVDFRIRRLQQRRYPTRRIWSPRCEAEEDSSETPPSADAPSMPEGASKNRLGPRSLLFGLGKNLKQVKNDYTQALEEVNALNSSPFAYVLGADLSKYGVSEMSVVQDLEIPMASRHLAMPPEIILQEIEALLEKKCVSRLERNEFVQEIRRMLSAVRGWTAGHADVAREMLDAEVSSDYDGRTSTSVDALVTLLKLAGFDVLPEFPEKLEPPSSDALPLGNAFEKTLDPTLVQGSAAVQDHVISKGLQLGTSLYYPHLFVATRGVSVVRRSGLLLPQKIRAMERTYLGWISSPLSWLLHAPLQMMKTTFAQENTKGMKKSPSPGESNDADCTNKVENGDLSTSRTSKVFVRRVVPGVRFDSVFESLRSLFLPTFTQEPCHEVMVLLYREVIPDRLMIQREKRKALLRQVRESLALAINPIPPGRVESPSPVTRFENESTLDGFSRPIGDAKPLSLIMFGEVPWGTMEHFLPSTFVLPATRDLLRVDALTLAGLASAVVTYLQNAESVLVTVSLAASFISYSVRVFFGLRQALTAYSGRIAKEKASGTLAQGRSCLDSLAALAAEEVFIETIYVWLLTRKNSIVTAQEFTDKVVGGFIPGDDAVDKWRTWLHENGL